MDAGEPVFENGDIETLAQVGGYERGLAETPTAYARRMAYNGDDAVESRGGAFHVLDEQVGEFGGQCPDSAIFQESYGFVDGAGGQIEIGRSYLVYLGFFVEAPAADPVRTGIRAYLAEGFFEPWH